MWLFPQDFGITWTVPKYSQITALFIHEQRFFLLHNFLKACLYPITVLFQHLILAALSHLHPGSLGSRALSDWPNILACSVGMTDTCYLSYTITFRSSSSVL